MEYTGNLVEYFSVRNSAHVQSSTIVPSLSWVVEVGTGDDTKILPDLVPAIIRRRLVVASTVFHVSDVTPVFKMARVVIERPSTWMPPRVVMFPKFAKETTMRIILTPKIHSGIVGTCMVDEDYPCHCQA
jgi:hypothetical protein